MQEGTLGREKGVLVVLRDELQVGAGGPGGRAEAVTVLDLTRPGG